MNKDKRTLIAITTQQWNKHHEAITAWMNGEDIEFKPEVEGYESWEPVETPVWSLVSNYRVKKPIILINKDVWFNVRKNGYVYAHDNLARAKVASEDCQLLTRVKKTIELEYTEGQFDE